MTFYSFIPKHPCTKHAPLNAFPAIGANFRVGDRDIFRLDHQVLPVKELHDLQIMATA